MDIPKLKPTRKNVLLQAFEWPDMTKSGIALPDMLKYSNTKGGKDPWRGKILAIGDEVKQVKAGEICRYQPGNYFRETIEEEGIRYIFFDEILIYAIEDENEKLIRALKNKIVFLPDKSLKEKYGILYLPQIREEKLLYGTIKVAGEGCGVEPGDRIVIENKSTWQYFDASGERYILTDRFNILSVIGCDCKMPFWKPEDLRHCAECGGILPDVKI